MSPETRRFLRSCRGPLLLWIGLVLLVAVTGGAAFSPLGPRTKTVIHLAVVAVQVALLAMFFMNLRSARGLIRFAAVAGVYWLVIMFVLTFNDFASRPSSNPCHDAPAFTSTGPDLCDSPVP
jgi:cytochrome c oxidase subunit 4